MDELPTIRWALDLPARAGRVIGIVRYRERIIIACERSVFEYWTDFTTDLPHLTLVDGQLWEEAQAADARLGK